MAGKDIIRMTQEELKRLHVIKKVIEGIIRQEEAREIIGLSRRQIIRLVKRIREEGDRGIIHKLRGRKANRKISEKIRDKVISIYNVRYSGFGPTFATEKLLEEKGIKISNETLRKWLMEEGIRYPRRKKRPHRNWRERKPHCGQMVQIDGSHHDWFEGRGPKCVFMGYIDDATNRIFGHFYGYEGTIPAMESFKRYIESNGIPLSVYVDKHTTYKSPAKPTIEDELNGTKPLSQFQRALKELGVEVIPAHSPQAKGRIERLFETLQDRLIKEMRLRNIKSIQEANEFLEEYLPAHNQKFSIAPKEKADVHMPLPKEINLDGILCIKTKRTLKNDFTVSYKNTLYQIEDNIRSNEVAIEERLDGSLVITHKGRSLTYKEILTRPSKKEVKKDYRITKRVYRPAADHPWKKFPTIPYHSQLNTDESAMAKR